jgi:predicted component of type VI protein secretion system
MSWTIHLRAVHNGEQRSSERVVERCPVLLGRDEAQSACPLDGDPSVSKVHASIDVRGDRLFVCDVRSTNGTFTRTGRLDPDRWTDIGAAEEENEIRLGGWHVFLRARRAPVTHRAPAPTTGTVIEPLPFGASQSRTSVGSPVMPALLTSFPAVVDRLSEAAHAARLAVTALERAVAHEIERADAADRAALVAALRKHYPELRSNAALAPHAPPPSIVATELPAPSRAEALSLALMQELSHWYVDAHTTLANADDIVAFKGRLKAGMDAFVLGMIQAISGLDSYVQQMRIAPEVGGGSAYPRNASEFARVVFDWRDGTGDGAAIVRRAFMDLSIHQVAFFNAVCFGIRELLHELSPESIEGARSAKLAQRGFWGRLVARFAGPRDFLEAYRRRYTDLATEESAHFALIFGSKFAEEYRSFVQETRASSAQAYAAPQASHAARGARGGTVPLAPGLAEPSPAPPPRGGTVPLAPGLREDNLSRGRRP